jgi:hypothetical protein
MSNTVSIHYLITRAMQRRLQTRRCTPSAPTPTRIGYGVDIFEVPVRIERWTTQHCSGRSGFRNKGVRRFPNLATTSSTLRYEVFHISVQRQGDPLQHHQ